METVVSMSGRLGNNVELRRTDSQVDYASFRLATSRRMLRDGEWVDGPTSWVTVKSFRQLARNATMSLRKGQAVVVVGRLEVEEWVTNDGIPRESAVLYAHALGHDLNWGVSTLHRLERQRTEPVEATAPASDDDRTEHGEQGTAGDDAEDMATAESFAASIAAPVG